MPNTNKYPLTDSSEPRKLFDVLTYLWCSLTSHRFYYCLRVSFVTSKVDSQELIIQFYIVLKLGTLPRVFIINSVNNPRVVM